MTHTTKKLLAEKEPEVHIVLHPEHQDSLRTTRVYPGCYAQVARDYVYILAHADGPGARPRAQFQTGSVVGVEHHGSHDSAIFRAKGQPPAQQPPQATRTPSQRHYPSRSTRELEMADTAERPALSADDLEMVHQVHPQVALKLTENMPKAEIRPAIPPLSESGSFDLRHVTKGSDLPRRFSEGETAVFGVPLTGPVSPNIQRVQDVAASSRAEQAADYGTFQQEESADSGEEPAIMSSDPSMTQPLSPEEVEQLRNLKDPGDSDFFGDDQDSPPGSGSAPIDEDSTSAWQVLKRVVKGPGKEEVYEVRSSGELLKKPYRPSGSSMTRKVLGGHRKGGWLLQHWQLALRLVGVPVFLAFVMLGASYGPHPGN